MVLVSTEPPAARACGRSCPCGLWPGAGRRVGPGVRGRLPLGWAAFLGGWILGNDDDSLLPLAENYNRTTTGHHRGTERTEDAQRLFWQRFRGRLRLADPCGLWAAAPGSPSTMPHPCRGPSCASCASPVGQAVRACGDVVLGELACLTSDRIRGQEAGRAEITGSREAAKFR